MDQRKIGKFITDTRKNMGMTQKDLAQKIGVSDKTVSKWETGNGLPEISLLKPLCDALAMNVNELLSGERLEESAYSEKAEENMMSLIQENEKHKNGSALQMWIGGVLAVVGILLLVFSCTSGDGVMISSYLDLPSLIVLVIFCAAGVFLSGKRSAVDILSILEKITIPCSMLICLFAVVVLMHTLDDPGTIGPHLAVCVLTPLYGLFLHIIVVIWKAHLGKE